MTQIRFPEFGSFAWGVLRPMDSWELLIGESAAYDNTAPTRGQCRSWWCGVMRHVGSDPVLKLSGASGLCCDASTKMQTFAYSHTVQDLQFW